MDYALPEHGVFIGRALVPGYKHPRIVTVRQNELFDITQKSGATVRDIVEFRDAPRYVRTAEGTRVGSLAAILADSWEDDNATRSERARLLSPIDLQAVKAAGVTFAASMLERVIEEQALGDKFKAEALRNEVTAAIGVDLSRVVPGSAAAMEVKKSLVAKGLWSQYLEVGIGSDPEIFTKAQPMATVGHGAFVGVHPASHWNNPEPEVALLVNSGGVIMGVTLANDVNLRDVEGRSALLLGKAKDNNASAAVGPFIRLLDEDFGLDDVKDLELSLRVKGSDGFILEGSSSMKFISRPPEALVAAAIGPHHQYPDGLLLMLGTMFAPTQDRDEVGSGFTHKVGDLVEISTPALGKLANKVRSTDACPPWTYGTSHLLRDLSAADLL